MGSSNAFAVVCLVSASTASSKVKDALVLTRANAKCSAMLAQ